MALTRVSLLKGKSTEYKQAILKNLYIAMNETFNLAEDNDFMVIHEHESDGFVYGKNYLNIPRTDDLVIIQITANNTRTLEEKKALYARIAELLNQDLGVRKEDVFISLLEVKKEAWSLGCGLAQYA
ncbi:tautomerase family protein [Paenibacillus beijingensis]|uniref:4-oxalocrotonate tautomerase n=1 Tax=Paenibacillus beijingensis TaxID=1126833 RepID=A0A0D5NEY3_9BACL|nr:tautomerase family protein [Paenibacillus beijingensis]AJY73796.1 4-oxalocrotonate tautomerase [Paenibacillus beijingensis]